MSTLPPQPPESSGISLYECVLVDIGDNCAPPERVLRVHVIGDSVSLEIARCDDDHEKTIYTLTASVAVDLHTLRQVLAVGLADDERGKYRPKDDPCYRGVGRGWVQAP